MARTTPIIKQDGFLYQEQHPLLHIDTPAWFTWLETASSFAFEGTQGNFTARRERATNKRGGWYWKAYTRRHGTMPTWEKARP